ncbi:MAG: autotransporter domain-containing protein [Pseudomonadota bacterium]
MTAPLSRHRLRARRLRPGLCLSAALLGASAHSDINGTNVNEIVLETEVIVGPFTGGASDFTINPANGLRLLDLGSLVIDGGNTLTVETIRSEGGHSVLLTGAGSTLALGDELIIGDGAGTSGTLDILSGATLTLGGGIERGFLGSELLIGSNGGTGVATVNGATVVLDRNADLGEVRLTVGRGGNGTLDVLGGASVTVQDLSGELGIVGDGITVGQALPGQNAVGVLNVDGAGTIVRIDTADLGALVAGVSASGVESASGTINITGGATFEIVGTGFNSGINLGRGGNSTGILNISGASTTLDVTGPQGVIAVAADFGGEIGDGTGQFFASDQAVVNVQGLTPGNGAFAVGRGTGNGLLDVSTGATINIDGFMRISVPTASNSTQSGTVNVNSGGVINTNWVEIGNRGSIVIDGADSVYNVGDELLFQPGTGGTASLTVSDGGLLNIGGGTDIGLLGGGLNLGEDGTSTTALVDAATVIIDRNADNGEARLSVGRGGNATLTVQNGGQLTVQDDSGVAGFRGDGIGIGEAFNGRSANGALLLQGAGTVANVESADSAFLAAGLSATGVESGIGTVDVLNGAVLNITGVGADAFLNLARGGNSQGTLTIDGAGSQVNVQGERAFVAVALEAFGEIGDGKGLLTVANGGELNIAGAAANQGFLIVGDTTGNGVVEINDGGTVNIDGALVISQGDSTLPSTSQTGRVTVTGTGILNAEAIGIGERGVLEGDGSINADRLFLFTGGQATLQDLSGYSLITFDGGDLTTPNAFDLGLDFDQSVTVAGGGTFSATGDSIFGAGSGASSITINDAASVFAITGDASVRTSLAVNSGGVFRTPGAITVGDGGILSGDGGTIEAASVTLGAGSQLAPGNSPGILNITGDLLLDGGTIAFEIAGNQPGEFDVLNVDGDVDLSSGTISVEVLNGFNPAGQNYDVLTASGSYTQDPGVVFTNVGVGPDFEYIVRTEGTTTIGAINFLSVDIAGLTLLTDNQRSLAGYLDSVCPVVETLAGPSAAQIDLDLRCGGLRNGANSEAQVATALDQLSPDEIFGTYQQLLNFTTIQHGNLARRLNGLRNGGTRIDLRSFNIESEDIEISGEELQNAIEELVGEELDRWGFFSDGRINFGDRDAGNSIPGFEYDTISLTLGTDYRVRDNFVLGAALGYNEVEADFDAGGGIDIEAWTLSLLGSYFQGNSFYVDLLASYGISDVRSERQIVYQDAGGAINRRASGSTDSDQFSAGVGSGWDFSRGRWVFGPHIGANYADIRIDGYTEQGALGLNLALPDNNVRSLTLNGGLHASFTLTPRWGVVVPYARLDYVRELQDNAETARVRLANEPLAGVAPATSPFRVRTEHPDNSYVVWSVGAHAQFIRGFAAFADYRSIAGLEDMSFSEFTLGLRYETKF